MNKKIKKVILGVVIGVVITIGMIYNIMQIKIQWTPGAVPSTLSIINNRFWKYEGKQKGSYIKDLIRETKIYNENLEYDEKSVILEGGDGINNIEDNGIQTIESSSIMITRSYIVTIEEYYENAQIKKIHIEEAQKDSNNEVKTNE